MSSILHLYIYIHVSLEFFCFLNKGPLRAETCRSCNVVRLLGVVSWHDVFFGLIQFKILHYKYADPVAQSV
jgi:hypothetical protein